MDVRKIADFETGAIVRNVSSWEPRAGRVHRKQDEDGVEHIGVLYDLLAVQGEDGPAWITWDGPKRILEFPPNWLFERVEI